ncbi:thioredoxin-like protein, partial [Dimargaris cristalligena]
LTEDNFESLIKDGPWFIKFYAPWCIHCQHLAPTWEALAKELAGDIHVGEVDCMSFGSFCNNKGITGYPTLTFYLEGSSVNFSGDRTVESL